MLKKISIVISVITLISFFALKDIANVKGNVFFLDIGQGDSTLIVSDHLSTILIDGGPADTVLRRLGETLPFFMRRIDVMILTHPHKDHIEGLVEVLKRYHVSTLLFVGDTYKSSLYEEFLRTAKDRSTHDDTVTKFVCSKTDFCIDNLCFDVLAPSQLSAGKTYANTNNASIVLKMTSKEDSPGDRSFLFTGDCEKECEEELVEGYGTLTTNLFHSTVLKVGHHGSRTSTTPEFLSKVDPKIAVISAGKNNQFSHPHPETLGKLKGVELHRTDLEGTVKIPIHITPS